MKLCSADKNIFNRKVVAHSNEAVFCYPRQSNLISDEIFNFNINRRVWLASDVQTKETMQVVGLGVADNEIFDVSVVHKPTEIGTFKNILANAAYLGEMILSILFLPIIGIRKSFVFINGPVTGSF